MAKREDLKGRWCGHTDMGVRVVQQTICLATAYDMYNDNGAPCPTIMPKARTKRPLITHAL
jgi:hypothetical protein